MEYDRQQREYWRQQEQQRQEQQLQQQQMNENTRRQQEQMKQLNAPAGQGPTPGQGPTQRTPSGAPGGQALEESTDYVYRGNQRYQQHNVLWNVRVDVREGANNSVKLDQANLISIN